MDLLEVGVLLVLKVCLIAFLFLYLIFGAVVVKQARLMTETLALNNERLILFVAYAHFFVALLTFLLSLIIL